MSLAEIAPWLSVVGTVVAIGAAILATWAALRTLKLERARDAAASKTAQRAQATGVSAWMSRRADDIASTAARPASPSIEGRNASDLPIYDVKVYLWVGSARNQQAFTWIDVAVMPPTDTTEVLSYYDVGTPEQQEIMNSNSGVSMEFTDAAGFRWYRARGGALHELPAGTGWQQFEHVSPDYRPEPAPGWMNPPRRSAGV